MFAALFFERDPLRLADLPVGLAYWVQVVGGFALFGLVLWLAFGLSRWKPRDFAAVPAWQKLSFSVGLGVALLCYGIGAVLYAIQQEPVALRPGQAAPEPFLPALLYTIGGVGALVAACVPFLLDVPSFRSRRVLALARLSFKEAIGKRVLVVFSALLLVFLFGSWFITGDPKDQLRTYVGVLFTAMGWLLFVAAALVSAFSIPADIRQQTIHTIVTKPVERFEIALGRFLGFYALLSLVLVVISTLGLLYIFRGINPEAVEESLKAREPHYGELYFENTDKPSGTNVGREWEYRGYITVPDRPDQAPPTARWEFAEVPAHLGGYKTVLVEYTFDVYRTTKGKEGQDVACDFLFQSSTSSGVAVEKFREERMAAGADLDALAEKHGVYEVKGQPITDYRTQSFRVPGGLFRNASKAGGKVPLVLRVTAGRQTANQYVGMAKYDFFLRLDSTSASTGLFALNYYKAVFGLWLQLGLVVGLAVVISTYLNGIITLLAVACLMLGGTTRDFIKSVGLNQNVGGGPGAALQSIMNRQVATVRKTDSDSASDMVVTAADDGFRWLVRRILNVLPDTDRFNNERYLAEGFNISLAQLLLGALLLLGYLVPWFVLSYYLLRWREVASAT
ncbi:MAG: ABC transporter permease [Gemmataceae bacterium]|nr:ABC transporter permease [Gemmataceae bacterium]